MRFGRGPARRHPRLGQAGHPRGSRGSWWTLAGRDGLSIHRDPPPWAWLASPPPARVYEGLTTETLYNVRWELRQGDRSRWRHPPRGLSDGSAHDPLPACTDSVPHGSEPLLAGRGPLRFDLGPAVRGEDLCPLRARRDASPTLLHPQPDARARFTSPGGRG
jgi:hypothetical protein